MSAIRDPSLSTLLDLRVLLTASTAGAAPAAAAAASSLVLDEMIAGMVEVSPDTDVAAFLSWNAMDGFGGLAEDWRGERLRKADSLLTGTPLAGMLIGAVFESMSIPG